MEFLNHARELLGLGLDAKDLTFLNLTCRALIVFFASLLMLRLSAKRFLPHKTAFDAILFFTLASMFSRAINGGAAFFPTLGVGFVLIALHRLLAVLACRSHKIGWLVKGSEDVLVKEGHVLSENLRRNDLSEEDLLEEMRLNGNVGNASEIREARFERSGEISVIKK